MNYFLMGVAVGVFTPFLLVLVIFAACWLRSRVPAAPPPDDDIAAPYLLPYMTPDEQDYEPWHIEEVDYDVEPFIIIRGTGGNNPTAA